MKKIITVFLCGIMLLCFAACDKNTNSNIQSAESTNQGETNNSENIVTNTQSTDSSENTDNNTEPSESIYQNDTNNQAIVVFNTKYIKCITFYAYYGNGKGSDVPAEYFDEIITWLDSFTIDKEAPEILPPGTNTVNVEIEYLDGTVVKNGLDTITVDGITYYIKGDTAPECYNEIISKVSLN